MVRLDGEGRSIYSDFFNLGLKVSIFYVHGMYQIDDIEGNIECLVLDKEKKANTSHACVGSVFPCSVCLVCCRDVRSSFMCSDIREKSIAAVRIFLSKEKLTLLPSAATS